MSRPSDLTASGASTSKAASLSPSGCGRLIRCERSEWPRRRSGFMPRVSMNDSCAIVESGHKAEWHLSNAEDFLAEAFASRRTGYRREKDGAAELLHGFERGLHGAPVGEGGGEPLVLLLRQRDTDRLALHFAGPLVARTARPGPAVLDEAFTDPAGLGQTRA